MTTRALRIAAFTIAFIVCFSQAPVLAVGPDAVFYNTVNLATAGGEVVGSHQIITCVNPLAILSPRVSATITYASAPNIAQFLVSALGAPALPSLSNASALANASTSKNLAAKDTITPAFVAIQNGAERLRKVVSKAVREPQVALDNAQRQYREDSDALSQALAKVKPRLASPSIPAEAGKSGDELAAADCIAQAKATFESFKDATQKTFDIARDSTWPDLTPEQAQANDLQLRLDALQGQAGFPQWKKSYGEAFQRTQDLLKAIRAVIASNWEDSSGASAFKHAHDQFMRLYNYYSGLSADSAEISYNVNCTDVFGKNSQYNVFVAGMDAFQTDSSKAQIGIPLVSVDCLSRLSASFGVGRALASIPHYAIVASKPAPPAPPGTSAVNLFAQDSDANGSLNIAYLAHVNLFNTSNNPRQLHFTVGPTLDFANHASVGLFSGFSYSYFRSGYLSAGWTTQSTSYLGGGWQPLDQVPANVTAAPLFTTWRSRFSFYVSFPVDSAPKTKATVTTKATTQP